MFSGITADEAVGDVVRHFQIQAEHPAEGGFPGHDAAGGDQHAPAVRHRHDRGLLFRHGIRILSLAPGLDLPQFGLSPI